MNEDSLLRLVERNENKIWGKYRGVVHERNDPDQLGRLRVKVPSLLGDAVTGWAWPVSPYAGAGYGLLAIPQVGDVVWVEFAEGDLEHPLWTGGGWAKPGGNSEIPAEAKRAYPDTQVLRTRSGHVIVLDDAAGQEKITIRARSGCEVVLDPVSNRVTIKADAVVIESGGSAQALATETFVEEVFKVHTHSIGMATTGGPNPLPVTPPGILTSVLKAE